MARQFESTDCLSDLTETCYSNVSYAYELILEKNHSRITSGMLRETSPIDLDRQSMKKTFTS